MSQLRLIEFDAETFRTFNPEAARRVEHEATTKRPAQNTKKELKDTWDTTDAREERVREALSKTAVDVLLAEPILTCWSGIADGRLEDEPEINVVDCMARGATCDADHVERQRIALTALAQEWDDVAGPDTIWVGHNICKFDLPVLHNAWLRQGIRVPTHYPQFVRGYWRGRIFDTMQHLPCGDGYIKLDEACAALGVPGSPECLWRGKVIDGSLIGEIFEAGDFDAILPYGMGDIPPLHAMYCKLTDFDRRATFDRGRGMSMQLAEIRDAGHLTEGQRLMAVWSALELAGLVPRAA